MDDRARRIGMNEAVFREVNERIDQLAQTFRLGSHPLDLVCECGNASCAEQIRMTPQEYEQLREDATLFVIYPGHDLPEVEDVVEKREGYEIVRKRAGGPAELARETDPRS